MLACAGLFALSAAAQTGQIGYKAAKDADSKKTLLLKNFHPQPMLQVPAHEIKRAKFPVIDAHTHTNDAMGVGGGRVDPAKFVERWIGATILGGSWSLLQMDWCKIDDPNFSQLMVKQVDDSIRRTSMTRNLVR